MNPQLRLKALKERLAEAYPIHPNKPINPTYPLYTKVKAVFGLYSMSYYQFQMLIGSINDFVVKNRIK